MQATRPSNDFRIGAAIGAERDQSRARAADTIDDGDQRSGDWLPDVKLLRALLEKVLTSRWSSRSIANLEPGRLPDNLLSRIDAVQADAERATRSVQQGLKSAGLTPAVIELLQSWVESTVDARVLQQDLELQRLVEEAASEISVRPNTSDADVMGDPVAPLTATALGEALGNLSDETVRARERAGEIFSILRPGRKRGREYPAFQAWPGIAGAPLAQVLAALKGHSGTAAYGFFTSPNRDLAGLTPIEMLLGRVTNARALEGEATELLAVPNNERLDTVLAAAQAYAADLAA